MWQSRGDDNQPEPGAVTVRTAVATPDLWDDVVAAFGRRGNDPNWCWCRRFMADPEVGTVDNRDALRTEISSADVPPGLIAYVGDAPVGWTRVMPRSAVPGVLANRALRHRAVDLSRFSRRSARRRRRRGAPRRHRRIEGRPRGRVRPLHRDTADLPCRRLHRDRSDLPVAPGHAHRHLTVRS